MATIARALALIAAAFALTATADSSALAGTASSAHAIRPESCSTHWINIGNPGDFYWYGTYVGQVEQEYDTCSGTARAHWQWSYNFYKNNPGFWVSAEVLTPNASAAGPGADPGAWQPASDGQDVFSPGTNIHNASPDNWYAYAWVSWSESAPGCGPGAEGDLHIYATGGTSGVPTPGGCDVEV